MNEWNLKRLCYAYGIFTVLLLTWHIPFTFQIWESIDLVFSNFINSALKQTPFVHNTLAYLNSNSAHWAYDVLIVLMFFPYFAKAHGKGRAKRLIFIAFLVLWHLSTFYVCHRLLVWKLFHLERLSPSLTIDGYFHLSDVIHWTYVKVTSYQSYPSDHGYTVFSFIIAMYYLRGRFWALIAFLISIPFGFPRFFVGAHWISDYFMGSLLTALFNFSWIYASPLPEKLPNWIIDKTRMLYAKTKKSPR